mgnify:CR=1 FL=1
MAIIKCPECGHQVSEKAPTCPSCGVEIAGNITVCPNCKKIYLSSEDFCPHCYHPNIQSKKEKPVVSQTPPPITALAAVDSSVGNKGQDKDTSPLSPKKKRHTGALLTAFIITVIVCGASFYLYNKAQMDKENEEYEYAIKSGNPLLLQEFLDAFKNATQAHRDTVAAHLQMIRQAETDWNNAVVTHTRTAIMEYLEKYPDTSHRAESKNIIDTIDWQQSLDHNSIEGYERYMTEHPEGNFYDEAEQAMKKLKAKDLTPEEQEMVTNSLHRFFESINSRDEASLKETVAEVFTLLDKTNATKEDAVAFMRKLYKEDISSMTWKLPGSYDIKKREIGDGKYEYNVVFEASQKVEHADKSKSINNQYRITSTINPEGKISLMKLVRLIAD